MRRQGEPRVAREASGGVVCLSGFGRPFGLAQDDHGRLLVADMDIHGLCRFTPDLDGCQWLRATEGWSQVQPLASGVLPRSAGRAPARFNGPHSVAVGADGTLYVVTYYSPGLHIVPPAGGPGRETGGGDTGPQLRGPATVQPDGQGRLLVSEYALNGIFAYDMAGRFTGALGGGRAQFGSEGSFAAGTGAGSFDRPHMCRTLPGGHLVVADTWNHRIQRFSAEGVWSGQLSGGQDGWRPAARAESGAPRPSAFVAPVAIGATDDGRFVVTDWGNGRLHWFDSDAALLAIDDSLGLEKPYDAQVFGPSLAVANSHMGSVLLLDLPS